jgi:mannose-1-phosphate guanylyltransferase/mannose-6-phosphate isomerase
MAADNTTAVYAVLLAGGVGSRLWPESRELNPKQLVKFIGKDSLVQTTVKRLLPVMAADDIRIVCGHEHSHEISRHLREIGIPPDNKIISEPCGRNTAPAILLAVLTILREEVDAIVCVFPADHVIGNATVFQERLRIAITLAERGHIVTFGITPHYPETGYGYIEGGEELFAGALKTERFVEKPDLETARKYLQADNFFWNSGMFAFRASIMLEEFERVQPELLKSMYRLGLSTDPPGDEGYANLPSISIDYAIMEHTHRGAVLPSDFGWSDIGTWKSLYEFLPKNRDANVIDGDVIANDTRNCFIMGHERLIATNCIENLVVVETPDAIFVSDIDASREVKRIVAQLKERGREEYLRHRTRHHPWGTETLLERKEGYTVNRLVFYPDSTYTIAAVSDPSWQWTVVAGKGCIDVGAVSRNVSCGETINAALGDVVTIENRDDQPLVVIQLACAEG